jgi:hypothetical protein
MIQGDLPAQDRDGFDARIRVQNFTQIHCSRKRQQRDVEANQNYFLIRVKFSFSFARMPTFTHTFCLSVDGIRIFDQVQLKTGNLSSIVFGIHSRSLQ